MRVVKNKITTSFYKKILTVLPVACVDIVIIKKNQFLLSRRKNIPAQGKWWLVGGRILKGETLKAAAKRKVYEETGLRKFRVKKFITAKETFFKNNAFGSSTHSINSVFLVSVTKSNPIKPDSQSLELRWFSKINPNWPKYVKDMLKLSGLK